MGSVLEKPSQVKNALYLLLAYLATNCIFRVYTFVGLMRSAEAPIVSIYLYFMGLVVALAIGIFLIAKISKGKNWARIIILIFGILITLRHLYETATAFPKFTLRPLGELILVGWLLYIIGVIFLFLPASNSWFRAQRQFK